MVEGKGITELKDKFEVALNSLTPPPPMGTKIQEINKLRNGGIVIQLSTKEAADWLQDPANEIDFTSKLDDMAYIKDRAYPIVVPRIPLTFDPSNQEHLREIESANGLQPKTIGKARWIKPIYRRHPKQKFTSATLSLTSANKANQLIRDGMYINSVRTYHKRLKYEPKQCMKCRKWGHYTSKCLATLNVCSTCGEDHMTQDCGETKKKVLCCVQGRRSH